MAVKLKKVAGVPMAPLDSWADLQALQELDEALWIATSAPAEGLAIDPALLAFLDADGDGRVRCDDVLRGVRHLGEALADPEAADLGSATAVPATWGDGELGERLRRTTRRIQRRLGRADEALTLAEVRVVRIEEEERGLGEAGLVLPDVGGGDPDFLSAITAVTGGAPHPAGRPAVNEDCLRAFLERARARRDWLRDGAQLAGTPALAVLGDVAASADRVRRLAPKCEHWLDLCDLVRLDPELVDPLWRSEKAVAEADFGDPAVVQAWLQRAPLARPSADGLLSASTPLNPHFADEVAALLQILARCGAAHLDRRSWSGLRARLQPWWDWQDAAPPGWPPSIDDADLDRWLDDPGFAERTRALLAASVESSVVLDGVHNLEQALALQAGLLEFARSFAGMPDLYEPAARAVFEQGSLIFDGRRLELCVASPDPARHARFADASGLFVVFVEVRTAGRAPQRLAAPVTRGRRGGLLPGKWGLLVDRDGEEHPAIIVDILDNPISLGQALAAPFSRVGRALAERIEKLGDHGGKALVGKADAVVGDLIAAPGTTPSPPPPPAPASPSSAQAAGSMLAGGGIALAAVGSSLAFVARTLADIEPLAALAAVAGLLAAVLIPTGLVAWIRLRRRDLAAFLEGAGWGINATLRLTRRQARAFTTQLR